ncbi:MAG TPA: AI-2E family transporter [Byssovorax sp.]|jgi:predicted PurR-regulated permease PerM
MPSDAPPPSSLLTPTPSSEVDAAAHDELRAARAALHNDAASRAKGEKTALTVATAAAVATIVWIALPVATGILLGTLLAFAVQPLFERYERRVGPRMAALAAVAGSALALAGAISGLVWLFGARGSILARQVIGLFGPGGFGRQSVAALGQFTERLGFGTEELAQRGRALAESAAAQSASIAQTLLESTASGMLAIFFALVTMHYVLRNWDDLVLRAQEMLPLRPSYTAELISGFRRVGRTTLLGTIVTGVAQGVFAGLGYWICGVPEPVFFGAATAVASLVPAVGTMLVWVPAGVALVLLGHPVGGALELVWGGVVVVGISDYVIRPRLVGGEEELPSLVTFAALFGGVEVFGLKGLILGPVLMSLALAVLRLHASEVRRLRAHVRASGAPPTP